jgi:galactoside O-acetyltransferase
MIQQLQKKIKDIVRFSYWSARLSFLGERTWVSLGAHIQDGEKIHLGRDGFIGHGVRLFGNTAPPKGIRMGDRCVVREDAYISATDGEISVGNDCFIGPKVVISGNGGVYIGNKVLIAAHVCIASVNHRYDDPTKPIADQGLEVGAIWIGDGAWIGAHTTIVPHVQIGEGAVIGAGAVVHRSVPAYSVAVGNPLRIIGSRLDQVWIKKQQDKQGLERLLEMPLLPEHPKMQKETI